jgi:glyoxylase-like metal-dependent hydrolase (beta-lactamase superfamily II)
MEILRDVHFLKVPKSGIIDSSNIVVIRDADGLACVDIGGGGEPNIRQTQRLFEAEGLRISEIHTVLISHTHADHMGAIGHFRDLVPGMTVVDHEADAPFLRDNRLLNGIFDAELVARHFPGTRFDILEFYRNFCPISETRPDRTVVEGDVLEWGEFVFEVIHTPGHHPGHISLFERTHRDLFVGDMLGVEVPFYTPHSGGVEAYLASLDKYRALEPARIIPSHGDLIEEPAQAIEEAAGKVLRRQERLCEALKAGPRTLRELVTEVVRSPSQQAFPGVAIVASHLAKLANEGIVQAVEGNRIALTGKG